MDWIEVGHIDDIPRLGARVVKTDNGNIAVFRNATDEVFALLDSCPHKGGPLSQGIVYDRRVTCPLHNWVISLESGEATGPDSGCTNHYPVRIEENMIYVSLDKPESQPVVYKKTAEV
ncbi:MAG: nitrite reductase [Gammaproteobacteria bacterium RIFCSPLOWO2_02_FULL_47_50]|nr:MAG: nitrite reductase [Gammaproteobacteria bacterium RIFCSPLOWO2_12_47_11]OGT79500.1 MAG: nitrite reductase [Gammaproteobacteria bacterium RIFCSPLOWO2_02_FULL_47_50]